MKTAADIFLNILIFGTTFLLMIFFCRKDGKWNAERGKSAFRFFTCQSNVFCAIACLLTACCAAGGGTPEWIRMLKFAGTAAVTVTMLTVFLFLAPSIGKGWAKKLVTGTVSDLFMHLLNPLMALVSFCFLEKNGMNAGQAVWGVLPVFLYGILYIYKVLLAPERKRWDDFYGFNRNGKWPLSCAAMLAASFLISLCLIALQNI